MKPNPNRKLLELIKKAQGNRSQNKFSQECDISSASITRISTGTYVPSAKILKNGMRTTCSKNITQYTQDIVVKASQTNTTQILTHFRNNEDKKCVKKKDYL